MIDNIPKHHRAIAKHIAYVWKARPQVKVWSCESGNSAKLAIANLEQFPIPEAKAFSTIGLSDFGGFEIAAVTALKNKSYVKALYDIGSYVIDGNRILEPGATFEKVIAHYYTRSNAGHILLTRLPLPSLSINELHFGSKTIKWLYAWSLTSNELVTFEKEGLNSFEERLQKLQLKDILSLERDTFPGVEHFDPWEAH